MVGAHNQRDGSFGAGGGATPAEKVLAGVGNGRQCDHLPHRVIRLVGRGDHPAVAGRLDIQSGIERGGVGGDWCLRGIHPDCQRHLRRNRRRAIGSNYRNTSTATSRAFQPPGIQPNCSRSARDGAGGVADNHAEACIGAV